MIKHPRTEHLSGIRRVVVKVGSAILTTGKGLDPAVIKRLADELAALHTRGLDIVLVTSAAVAAGRERMQTPEGRKDLLDLPGRQAASAIGQSRLMHEYDQALEARGIITAQVLLTHNGLKIRERFLNARNTLERLFSWRTIPIINENDTVSVAELEFGDNDTLAAMVAGLINADLCINLTSADGVFDRNPDIHPDATPLRLIKNIGALDIPVLCDGKTTEGSGGMYSKLVAARRAAQIGAPTLIISGKGQFSLINALDGHEIGTLILPEKRHISSKKFWLAYHDDPVGAVFVDSGAAKALANRGKSLLPAGIVRVEGEFVQDALIAIKTSDNETLGVGMTNYPSQDLKQIMGKKTSQIETLLGRAPFEEAVHRDKMLIDAALKEQ